MNLTHLLCCRCNVFWNRRIFLFLFNFLASTQVTVLIHSPHSLLWAPCCEWRVRHCSEQDCPASTRGTALWLLCTDAVDFHRRHDINTEGQNVRAGEEVSPSHAASLGGGESIPRSFLICTTRSLSTRERNWLSWGLVVCLAMGKTTIHSFQSGVLLPLRTDFIQPTLSIVSLLHKIKKKKKSFETKVLWNSWEKEMS